MTSGQNTSHAVMAQRVEPHDSLDDFPTPPWGTRALLEHVMPLGAFSEQMTVWEPSCNRGYMVRPLREYFGRVHASDIHDYDCPEQERVCDFLYPGSEPPHIQAQGVDWTVFNPPFRLAEQFVQRGLNLARVGVAAFVRTAFLEGVGRYNTLFRDEPPFVIAQFTERVILTKGIVRDPSKSYWCEREQKWKRPSTATAYCWLVWIKGRVGTRFTWIPPCRKQLERPGDYDMVEAAA